MTEGIFDVTGSFASVNHQRLQSIAATGGRVFLLAILGVYERRVENPPSRLHSSVAENPKARYLVLSGFGEIEKRREAPHVFAGHTQSISSVDAVGHNLAHDDFRPHRIAFFLALLTRTEARPFYLIALKNVEAHETLLRVASLIGHLTKTIAE